MLVGEAEVLKGGKILRPKKNILSCLVVVTIPLKHTVEEPAGTRRPRLQPREMMSGLNELVRQGQLAENILKICYYQTVVRLK